MACSNQGHCPASDDVCSYPIQTGTHRPHEIAGKRPDGVTLAPWKSGYLLVWDATCVDTLAALYRVHATSVPGKVEKKSRIYQGLPPGQLFAAITTIETLGAIGPRITSLS